MQGLFSELSYALAGVIGQFNLELSVLLVVILFLRLVLKKSASIYNLYWLWLALPLTPLVTLSAAHYALQYEPLSIVQTLFTKQQSLNLEPISALTTDLEAKQEGITSWATMTRLFAVIWALGAILFALKLWRQHLSLRGSLAAAGCQSPANLKARYPVVSVTEPEFSPAVYGFFKPKIYFPLELEEQLEPKQIELILQHEEQHIRHGHLWLNLAWDILVCFCWFNPLVYYARHSFRHDQELFCDYLVLKNSNQSHQRTYGHALISTVSATHSVSLLCSWKMFDQLEERIMNIKSQHPLFKQAILACALLSLLIGSALYAMATAKETPEHAEKPNGKVGMINITKIDTDDVYQVTIKADGKIYRLQDGERFILEDGKRRTLTEQESNEFAKLLEQSQRYDLASGKDKQGVFTQFKNVHSYTFDHQGKLEMDELQEKLSNLKPLSPPDPSDTETKKRIKKYSKVFRKQGDKIYELENGKRRELSEEESKRFTKLFEQQALMENLSAEEMSDLFDGQIPFSKRPPANRTLIKVPLAPKEAELVMISGADMKTIVGDEPFHPLESTELRIAQALSEPASENDTAAARKARKQLKKIQEKMAASRKKLKQQREQAKEQLAKLKKIQKDG